MNSLDRERLTLALEELANLLELNGANGFRVNAHTKAARAISHFEGDLEALIEARQLTTIEGIGQGMAEKIAEFAATGQIDELIKLRREIPSDVVAMTRIQGLGARKARALWQHGITSLGALKSACEEGSLAKLKGFGAKTAANILQGLERLARFSGRHRLDSALAAANDIAAALGAHPAVERVVIAGSLRRYKEIIGDVDLVAVSTDPEAVMAHFVSLDVATEIIAHGAKKSSIRLANDLQVDLRCVTEAQFPFALLHFTGSQDHNVKLRRVAAEEGLKLNEYGLFKGEGEKGVSADDEAAIYGHLGLQYIPPELREDTGEVEAAARQVLPKLIEAAELRGLLHLHTTYSDGRPTLEEYARWGIERGFAWLVISDHSQSLTVANGMTPERALAQQREIDAVNARYEGRGVRLIKGVESDILPDGQLDYPDDFLPHFELVIASIHSHFQLTKAEQTRRLCRALEHPATHVLGHMTGRLLLSRDGYPLDERAVLAKAAETGTAIEINANPHRLDLDWRWVRYAIDLGVKIAISPDAHRLEGLEHFSYGVGIARKGWATSADIINCWRLEQLLSHFKKQ